MPVYPLLPYISLTGFSRISEASELARQAHLLSNKLKLARHKLSAGILVSELTCQNETLLGRKHPTPSSIETMLGRGFPFDFAMHLGLVSGNLEIVMNIVKLFYQFPLARTLQINTKWPHLKQLKELKSVFPEMKIILQLPAEIVNSDWERHLLEREAYLALASGVLIDASGGTGKLASIEHSCSVMQFISAQFPHITLGVAGGLAGDNVCEFVQTMVGRLGRSDFSIDAQSSVREENGDSISPEKQEQYLQEALKAFGEG